MIGSCARLQMVSEQVGGGSAARSQKRGEGRGQGGGGSGGGVVRPMVGLKMGRLGREHFVRLLHQQGCVAGLGGHRGPLVVVGGKGLV